MATLQELLTILRHPKEFFKLYFSTYTLTSLLLYCTLLCIPLTFFLPLIVPRDHMELFILGITGFFSHVIYYAFFFWLSTLIIQLPLSLRISFKISILAHLPYLFYLYIVFLLWIPLLPYNHTLVAIIAPLSLILYFIAAFLSFCTIAYYGTQHFHKKATPSKLIMTILVFPFFFTPLLLSIVFLLFSSIFIFIIEL